MANKAITNYHSKKNFSAIAGEAIGLYLFLKPGVDADDNPVVKLNAAPGTDAIIGVSDNAFDEILKDDFEIGDPLAVNYDGIVPVKMSGTGSMGDIVGCNASSQGIAVDFTTSVLAQWVAGTAMGDWVDGQIIPVKLNIQVITENPAP